METLEHGEGIDSAGDAGRRSGGDARSAFGHNREERIDIFWVDEADVQGADRLGGTGLGWIGLERLQVGEVHPCLDALGRKPHRVRGRLVDADDANARRARARGIDGEGHNVAVAQRRLLGELTRDKDLREIDGRRRRNEGKGGLPKVRRSRSAAYARHARTSSRVSCGKSSINCCSDMPLARYPSTSPTVMRVPRTQGFPNRTAGSAVMRSRGFMESVYGSSLRPANGAASASHTMAYG